MKVLVVCHGNTHRSPAAAAVLRSCGVDATSAGFHIIAGRAAKKMRDAFAVRGYDLESHVPQLVTDELLETADLVVYMDRGNLRRIPPEHLHKAMPLVPGRSVPDPAFQARGSAAFAATAELLETAALQLAERLRSE